METQPIKVQFHLPRYGWLKVVVSYKGQDIPFYTSAVFDPYPDFLNWLESLARGELPCSWYIDEEDSFVEFSVYTDELGHNRLKMVGNRRDEGALDDKTIYTFIDEQVDAKEVACIFYTGFREMTSRVSRKSVQDGWGSNLIELEWERIERLLF